jgi:hypothetical protein
MIAQRWVTSLIAPLYPDLETSGLPSLAVSSTLAVTSISIGVAGDVADMDMDAHRALCRREERVQPSTKDSLWVSPTDRGTHSCPILMLMGQVIERRIAGSPHSSARSVAKR